MILAPGEKVLISHRRLFESDQPRFFVGIVESYEDGMVKVTGYSWSREHIRGEMVRKNDPRTKIVSVSSGMVIVYELDPTLELEALRLETAGQHEVFLTDGSDFRMNLTDRLQSTRLG